MAGNVFEWVHDWYDKKYYEKSPYKNPKGPVKGKHHVIRGGAWNSLPVYLRSTSRYGDSDAKLLDEVDIPAASNAVFAADNSDELLNEHLQASNHTGQEVRHEGQQQGQGQGQVGNGASDEQQHQEQQALQPSV